MEKMTTSAWPDNYPKERLIKPEPPAAEKRPKKKAKKSSAK